MPFSVEKLPDSPIVFFSSTPGGSSGSQMLEMIAAITHLLDQQTEKVFLVMDLRNLSLTLDDMLRGANMAARGRNALNHHPNIIRNVYIVTDRLLKMAVKGMATATFGQVRLEVFDTVEEALHYCRQHTLVFDLEM